MFRKVNELSKMMAVIVVSLSTISCVTETIESPNSMKFSQTSVISVSDPDFSIKKGSTFAWLPEAVNFYKDKRLENAPIKSLIEQKIVKNLRAKEMQMVESVNGARYAIAYTAALESALDDVAMVRRFGLMPGNSQVPTDDANIEKGSLIIYVFNNKTHDIVWRSAAQDGVKFDRTMQERKEMIEQIIGEMFMTFPVEVEK